MDSAAAALAIVAEWPGFDRYVLLEEGSACSNRCGAELGACFETIL